eukprot:g1405.t1
MASDMPFLRALGGGNNKSPAMPAMPAGLGGGGGGGGEGKTSAAMEQEMEAYADFLDELKESDPAKYTEIMTQLQQQMAEAGQAAQQGATAGKVAATGELQMPGKDGKVLKKGGKVKEQDPGQKIEPEPGFVIKTTDGDGAKVFVNVCSNKLIGEVRVIKKLMEDGSEQEGTNFPVSIGPAKPETDKAGKKCVVYDCVFNPKVVKDAVGDETGGSRQLLCDVCVSYLEQKYTITLDRRFKFPKLKYKGKKTAQWIRSKKAPVIEEVGKKGGASLGGLAGQGALAGDGAAKKKAKKVVEELDFAPYTVTAVHRDGEEVRLAMEEAEADALIAGDSSVLGRIPARLRIDVSLPKLPTVLRPPRKGKRKNRAGVVAAAPPVVAPADLEVSPWLVTLRVRGYHDLELFLPFPVEAGDEDEDEDDDDEQENEAGRESKSGEETKVGAAASAAVDDETKTAGVGNASQGNDTRTKKKNNKAEVEEEDGRPAALFNPVHRTLEIWLDVDEAEALAAADPIALTDDAGPDPGSRPWLLAMALEDSLRPETEKARKRKKQKERRAREAAAAAAAAAEEEEGLGVGSDEELPEDRFHAKDLMSRHFLAQKQEGKKRTAETHARKEAEAVEEAKAEQSGGAGGATTATTAGSGAGGNLDSQLHSKVGYDSEIKPPAAKGKPAAASVAPPTNKTAQELVFELD